MNYQDAFNRYLANHSVLNAKLHNLHWNVVGIQFMAIHTFTEELYDQFFEQYDAVAEHLKMMGKMPPVTLKEYLELATISEVEAKAFSAQEVLTTVKSDIEAMRRMATDIRTAADAEGDFIAVAMMEDHVAAYDKTLWFLSAMLA